MKSGSRLEEVLTGGEFAVTAELGPPQSANPEAIRKKSQYCLGKVDGVNITDNQTAIVRMSSIAAAAIAISCGLEPIVQMVCRDRNRIAMQSDILGAAALGVKNILCLSGDHQKFGNHPEAANVFDLGSMQLIDMVRKMRDDKQYLLFGHRLLAISDASETPPGMTGKETHEVHNMGTQHHKVLAATATVFFAAPAQLKYITKFAVLDDSLHMSQRRTVTGLTCHGELQIPLFKGGDHFISLFESLAHGLFQQNMTTELATRQYHIAVTV